MGGEDFDHRVMDYFIKLIKKKHKVDISKDNRALQKLRREAERAKRALSSQHQVCISPFSFDLELLSNILLVAPLLLFSHEIKHTSASMRKASENSMPSTVLCKVLGV